MRADAELRANVRLLGDLLGRVLVEQEGEELLELEERIRALSRWARRVHDRSALDGTIAALSLPQQAQVLRAFGVFFQLANIAEQHHRLRRRRAYEHEGRVARESLDDAFARLEAAGVAGDELAAGAAAVRVELVFTAHPTEATRRTVLAAHQRIAALLRELDDPELPPSARARVEDRLAEEITILWQTDEVRSRRPRVHDEIRHGLWFFERSLWSAGPELLRAYRRRLPGATPPLSFGSWIGGDLDGNPNAGPETVEAALDQARLLATRLYREEVRALAQAWGMSSTLVDSDPALGEGVVGVPTGQNEDEPYRRRLTPCGSGSAPTASPRPTSSWRSSTCSTAACAPIAARASPTAASPICARASSCTASTSRSSTCACTRARSAHPTSGCGRRCARARACSAGTAASRSTG